MTSPFDSADEGEIVEASPLPRSEQNGDVDRAGRNRGRVSATPEDEGSSRYSREGSMRRSRSPRSPRGWKRSRDDRDSRRDPRHFRVHYEHGSRDDRRRGYNDRDRPVSRGSHQDDDRSRYSSRDYRSSTHRSDYRGRDYDDRYDRYDDYPDKRARHRSRSRSRGRGDSDRRDRGRHDAYLPREDHKYSAQVERRSQDGSNSKRAGPVEASDFAKQDAKTHQGVTVERGINGLAISKKG